MLFSVFFLGFSSFLSPLLHFLLKKTSPRRNSSLLSLSLLPLGSMTTSVSDEYVFNANHFPLRSRRATSYQLYLNYILILDSWSDSKVFFRSKFWRVCRSIERSFLNPLFEANQSFKDFGVICTFPGSLRLQPSAIIESTVSRSPASQIVGH